MAKTANLKTSSIKLLPIIECDIKASFSRPVKFLDHKFRSKKVFAE